MNWKNLFQKQSDISVIRVFWYLFFFFLGLFLAQGDLSLRPLHRMYYQFLATHNAWEQQDTTLLSDTWNLIQSEYLYRENFPENSLEHITEHFVSYVAEEPYSHLTFPSQKMEFAGGIGISLSSDPQKFNLIEYVFLDSPAHLAGLKAGMQIDSIDGKSTLNLTRSEIIRSIRGPLSTSIQISIQGIENVFIMQRTPLIKKTQFVKTDDQNAILKFGEFEDKVLEEIQSLLEKEKAPIQTLTLDLRDNTGGKVTVLEQIMGLFVPEETIFAFQFRPNEGAIPIKAKKMASSIFQKSKICILTSRYTASSSEILAQGLRELRQAKITGEKTYGKYMVVQTFPVGKKHSLDLVTHEWKSVGGKSLKEGGIEPDGEC